MMIEMMEEDEGQFSSKKWRVTRKTRTRTLERRGGGSKKRIEE